MQDALRKELLEADPHGGDLHADVLDRLPLLDAVVRETLRL